MWRKSQTYQEQTFKGGTVGLRISLLLQILDSVILCDHEHKKCITSNKFRGRQMHKILKTDV